MKKINIAFIIHGLSLGGAEKFLVSLVNYLKKCNHNPIIILLSSDMTLSNEIDKNIKIYKALKKYRFDFSVSSKIKNIINENNCNHVFCINSYSFFLTKLSFLYNNSINFYLSPHTTIPFSIYNYLQTLIYYRLIGKSDTIIYLCENQKKYIKKIYLLNKSNEYIIYNGIDVEYFNPELVDKINIETLKKELNINNKEKIIVQIARISKEKRHNDSIMALAYLHKTKSIFAHLLIVGPGNDRDIKGLKETAEKLKITKYVHFIGNQIDVRKYYIIADLFTLTSTSETFSLAALEAMAYGIPCALTNVGGAKEMVIENITGRTMRKKNIQSISNSWEYLLKNIKNKIVIRNYVMNNFTSDIMLKKYDIIFQK